MIKKCRLKSLVEVGKRKFIKKVGILLFELFFKLVFEGVVFWYGKILDVWSLFKGYLCIVLFRW